VQTEESARKLIMKKIIDYKNNIEIDFENSPVNNIQHVLQYTADGIVFLVNIVKNEEDKKANTLLGEAVFHGLSNNESTRLLANYFNWFAISVVNYIRLVGLLDIMVKNNWGTKDINSNSEEIRSHCNKYLKEVAPEIYNWRNKIAAHFAITDPKNDNVGTLEFSVLNPISFRKPHYYVGTLQFIASEESSSMQEWSLVDIFENRLIPRYWPIKAK
jgi:hypothetical protein